MAGLIFFGFARKIYGRAPKPLKRERINGERPVWITNYNAE
jgi:hypothetical protein